MIAFKNNYVVLLIIFIVVLVSCKNIENDKRTIPEKEDNPELIKMHKEDQSDRTSGNIDWNIVSQNDSNRRERVNQLLDSSLVNTSLDYYNAAMIFQHGNDTISSSMAVKMMKKSIELDPSIDRWLLAAAIDRDLMRKNQPQIYGTQFIRKSAGSAWERYDLDSTKVSDEERLLHGVETLDQQREKEKTMNKKRLNALYSEHQNIDQIVSLIKDGDSIASEYNISENGINLFGYNLMAQEKNDDALKVLKLNTELFPNSSNVFDSYGECLLKIGKKDDAIKAYRKSLKMNPKNKNAEKVLSEIEN